MRARGPSDGGSRSSRAPSSAGFPAGFGGLDGGLGDQQALVERHYHTSQAEALAGDIRFLEERAIELHVRNRMLTQHWLEHRQKSIERTLGTTGKALLRHVLKGWNEYACDDGLQHQLDHQTDSLQRCEQVASKLGQAIQHEREIRGATEASNDALRVDLQEVLVLNGNMQRTVDAQAEKLRLFQQRLKKVERCLQQAALCVIQEAEGYEKWLREESDKAHVQKVVVPEVPKDHHGVRDSAAKTMRQVSQLLSQTETRRREPTPQQRSGGRRSKEGGDRDPSIRIRSGSAPAVEASRNMDVREVNKNYAAASRRPVR